jgi:hypothetical protein
MAVSASTLTASGWLSPQSYKKELSVNSASKGKEAVSGPNRQHTIIEDRTMNEHDAQARPLREWEVEIEGVIHDWNDITSWPMWKVYGLIDKTEPLHIRYVGQTADSLRSRLQFHRGKAKKTQDSQLHDWIRSIPEDRLSIVRLQDGSEQEAIDRLRSSGHDLLNKNKAGSGRPFTVLPQTIIDKLGTMPDAVLAEEIGVSPSLITRRRWAEDRPPFRATNRRNDNNLNRKEAA